MSRKAKGVHSVLCVVAKHHENDSIKRIIFESCEQLGFVLSPAGSEVESELETTWKVTKTFDHKLNIEVVFYLLDRAGPSAIKSIPDTVLERFTFVTTVGCCAGSVNLPLELVVPVLRADVGIEEVTCDFGPEKGLDGASIAIGKRVTEKICTEGILNPTKAEEQRYGLPVSCVEYPRVITVESKVDKPSDLEKLFNDHDQAICLDMEIGYLWKRIKDSKLKDRLTKLRVFPAFKGVSDHGDEEERKAHRVPATKNACVAMLEYVQVHFQS